MLGSCALGGECLDAVPSVAVAQCSDSGMGGALGRRISGRRRASVWRGSLRLVTSWQSGRACANCVSRGSSTRVCEMVRASAALPRGACSPRGGAGPRCLGERAAPEAHCGFLPGACSPGSFFLLLLSGSRMKPAACTFCGRELGVLVSHASKLIGSHVLATWSLCCESPGALATV